MNNFHIVNTYSVDKTPEFIYISLETTESE